MIPMKFIRDNVESYPSPSTYYNSMYWFMCLSVMTYRKTFELCVCSPNDPTAPDWSDSKCQVFALWSNNTRGKPFLVTQTVHLPFILVMVDLQMAVLWTRGFALWIIAWITVCLLKPEMRIRSMFDWFDNVWYFFVLQWLVHIQQKAWARQPPSRPSKINQESYMYNRQLCTLHMFPLWMSILPLC